VVDTSKVTAGLDMALLRMQLDLATVEEDSAAAEWEGLAVEWDDMVCLQRLVSVASLRVPPWDMKPVTPVTAEVVCLEEMEEVMVGCLAEMEEVVVILEEAVVMAVVVSKCAENDEDVSLMK